MGLPLGISFYDNHTFAAEVPPHAGLFILTGHAVFEFIEERWGKEGLRQFLFSLRRSVIGGGADAYEESLKLSAEELRRDEAAIAPAVEALLDSYNFV